MPVYMVERILSGATIDQVELLRTSLARACWAARQRGVAITYLRSTFTPGESRCRCLFEAASGDLVREVNDAAQLPYSRIVLALDLPGDEPPT